MTRKQFAARLVLTLIVLGLGALPLLLTSCGVTEWQRAHDYFAPHLAQANSPEFQRAVQEALQ